MNNSFEQSPALLGTKEPKRILFVLKRKEVKGSSPARSPWRSVVKNDTHLRNSAHRNATGISWPASNSPRFVRLSFLRTCRPGRPRGQFQLRSRMCRPDICSDQRKLADGWRSHSRGHGHSSVNKSQYEWPDQREFRSDCLPTVRFPDVVKPFGSFSFFCRYKRSFFDSLEAQRIGVGI